MGLASDGQSHWTLEMMLSISQKYHVESSLCLATCDFANRHSIRDYSSSGQTDPVNADIARGVYATASGPPVSELELSSVPA